jgi:tetratricopeptide (TPR) repeat protein
VSVFGKLQHYFVTDGCKVLRGSLIFLALFLGITTPLIAVQDVISNLPIGVTIQGTVRDSARKPIADVSILIEQKESAYSLTTKSSSLGVFTFSVPHSGNYVLSAEKPGFRKYVAAISASPDGEKKPIDLSLNATNSSTIEFSDQPNFMIAGVTDWTAVGGHGSDASLRTSEALTQETLALKPENSSPTHLTGGLENKLHMALQKAPQSFDANHQLGEFYLQSGKYREAIPLLQFSYQIKPEDHNNEYDLALAYKGADEFTQSRKHIAQLLMYQNRADLHRILGDLDEESGDPLGAVHEYEQAARMDPSEENYFAWGSELLLHRAVWQAQEIFRKGTELYPQSERILTALGTALFAGGLYEQAALKLCDASDLNPAVVTPYIFLGKIDEVSLAPLPCIESKLERFVQTQPENALANYFYAMAVWKRRESGQTQNVAQQAEAFLKKAVANDPKCSEAWLQLGVLSSSQGNIQEAIAYYLKAIEANAQLSDAHYRLGIAYDRMGDSIRAKQELQLHEALDAQQAAAREQQRKEIKQFQVILENDSINHSSVQ